MAELRIAERARGQKRDERGESPNVPNPPDNSSRPKSADYQPGEIGGRHGSDDDGTLSRPLQPQAEQRGHETAAGHQHENGKQQAANRGDSGKHGDCGARRQVACRPSMAD